MLQLIVTFQFVDISITGVNYFDHFKIYVCVEQTENAAKNDREHKQQ